MPAASFEGGKDVVPLKERQSSIRSSRFSCGLRVMWVNGPLGGTNGKGKVPSLKS